MPLLILPRLLVIGDIIAYANEKVMTKDGRRNRYTFAGAEYFQRMKDLNLYSLDNEEIHNRVKKLNLDNIFNQKLL